MKKSIHVVLIIIVIIAILVLVLLGFTYGKYAYNSIWNSYLVSKSFYFESDKLDLNGRSISDNLWDGNAISFNLYNYVSEEEISDYDINYDVTCEVIESNVLASCNVSGAKGTLSSYGYCLNEKDDVDVSSYNVTECESSGYSWIESPATKAVEFSLESEEVIESAIVKITAQSISPYRKTLTGEFILNKDKKIVGSFTKEYLNDGLSTDLIISSSYIDERCVALKWDAKILKIDLDQTKYPEFATDENGYINELHFKIKPKDSLMFTFYKSNSSVQIGDSLTLRESNECQ